MTVDFDHVLLEIGDFGRYQKFVVYMLCIPACFLNVFTNLGLVFQAYTPAFRCVDDYNGSVVEYDDKCEYANVSTNVHFSNYQNATRECSSFEYDKEHFESTIITQFDLVCDRSIYYKTILSLFNALSIAGCFVYSYIQDRWGRKKAFTISLTAFLFGSVTSLFANNVWLFAVLRVPSVMGASATWSISYIWGLEYVGASKRAYVTFVMSLLYGVAAIVLGLLAWLCRTWVQLGLLTTCPFVLLYLFQYFVDESPRWLLTMGRTKEAEKTVRKMAAWQKIELKEDTVNKLLHGQSTPPASTTPTPIDIGFDKLFRNANILYKTLVITAIWFSIGVTDNTLDYNVENLGGNFYVAYVFQAAVQIPASFVAWLLLSKFGRVLPLSFSLIVFCGLFSLLTVPADLISIWVVMACAAAAKLGAYLALTIIYQLGVELYPTVLRGCGIGFSSAVADVGTICMPFIIHSSEAYKLMPMIVIGGFSLLSGFGCLLLPETSGKCLPESVDEAASQGEVGVKTVKTNMKRFFNVKLTPKSDESE